MGTWDDPDIKEASGLAYSRKWASLMYVHGDENGPLYAVNTSTGATVGKRTVPTLEDPEDLDIDLNGLGSIWDIGDNAGPGDSAVRDWVNLFTFTEPGPGYGSLSCRKYKLQYPGGTSRNAETGLTWPNGKRQIVTKEATGKVMQLPSRLEAGEFNQTTQVKSSSDLNFVAGGCVQKDGRWAFVVKKDELDTVFIFDSNWNQVDTIAMDAMTKPEGITITPGGKYLFVCDDDPASHGHYQRVAIPAGYQPLSKPWVPPNPNIPDNPCGS